MGTTVISFACKLLPAVFVFFFRRLTLGVNNFKPDLSNAICVDWLQGR